MFYELAVLFDNKIFFSAFLILILLLGEKRDKKIYKLLFILSTAALLSFVFKFIFAVDRPCVFNPGRIDCPTGKGFPSSHTTLAFALALGFLNKKKYLFYLAFALFIAYSRIYLGVHTLEDIAGGVVFASLSYVLGEWLWKKMSVS